MKVRHQALDVLLEVYRERKDLQAAFPEGTNGDCGRLLDWAFRVTRGDFPDSACARLGPHARWYRRTAAAGSDALKRRTMEFARRHLPKFASRRLPMRLAPTRAPAAKTSHGSDLTAEVPAGSSTTPAADLPAMKARKFERIRPLLRTDMPHVFENGCADFLTPELRAQFNIVDTTAVSSNDYDEYATALIEKHRNGLVLDCGAGRRSIYYENVVNFEIVAYDTTDVRGVGEVLPFSDDSFEAVFSLAVLEHVKDPFACAREIVRVLKPGGDLMCCVPFLQPLHGYPHHYYNMSGQGLKNLFEPRIVVDRHEVYYSVLPIWSLTWILNSWAAGLKGNARKEFLSLRVADLLESGSKYLGRAFVTELPPEKNFELASATVLFGHKKT